MERELSEQTRKRIAEHCRRIAVAQSLDEEIQRELAGHMEDKILGYLSGAERLSEEDAFVITRERFGDPARIKELLGGVHAGPAAASLGRRALALALMLNLYTLLAFGLHSAFIFLFNSFHPTYRVRMTFMGSLNPLLTLAIAGALFWALFRTLKTWTAELGRGRRPWALRAPAGLVALATLATFCLRPPARMLNEAMGLMTSSEQAQLTPWAWLITFAGFIVVILAMAFVWFWWCDSEPRRAGALWQAALWFVIYVFVGGVMDDLIEQAPTRLFNSSDLVLLQGHGWTYFFEPPTWSDIPGYLAILAATGFLTLFGLWIYDWARGKDDKQITLTS